MADFFEISSLEFIAYLQYKTYLALIVWNNIPIFHWDLWKESRNYSRNFGTEKARDIRFR